METMKCACFDALPFQDMASVLVALTHARVSDAGAKPTERAAGLCWRAECCVEVRAGGRCATPRRSGAAAVVCGETCDVREQLPSRGLVTHAN